MDIEARANHARQLLDDPLLQECLNEIEKEAVSKWIGTGLQDAAQREMLWLTVKASRRVREVLNGVVDDGIVAAARAARPVR